MSDAGCIGRVSKGTVQFLQVRWFDGADEHALGLVRFDSVWELPNSSAKNFSRDVSNQHYGLGLDVMAAECHQCGS
eukprot:771210-Pelagomonas_calceolata.AAC.1